MSQWDKLIEEILRSSNDLRFEELCRVLEAYGYRAGGGTGGSHVTFRKKGCAPITIPRKSPVKRVYVMLVRDVVEEAQRNENG